jgi:hypothetical protein
MDTPDNLSQSVPIPLFNGTTTRLREWQIAIRDFAFQLELHDLLIQSLVYPNGVDNNALEERPVFRPIQKPDFPLTTSTANQIKFYELQEKAPEKIIMSNRKVKESSVVEMVGEYGVLWEYASVTEAAKQNKKGFSTIMGSIKTGNRFKGVYFRWKVPRAADATYMVDILADTESEPETEPETEQPETEPEPETAETEVKGDFFSTLWEKLCRPH